jgi:hypothetical protein
LKAWTTRPEILQALATERRTTTNGSARSSNNEDLDAVAENHQYHVMV